MLAMRRLGWSSLCLLSACLGDLGHEDLSQETTNSTTEDGHAAERDGDDRGTNSSAGGVSPAGNSAGTDEEEPGDSGAQQPETSLPLQAPAGFAVQVFARETGDSRSLVAHGGGVYAARSLEGDIVRFEDADGDGSAERSVRVAECFEGVHGLTFHENSAFFATPSSLYRATVDDAGNFGEPTAIFKDLPSGGLRPKHGLINDGGALYLSTGSSCEGCVEQDPERASILRIAFDGSTRSVFSRGLRNPLAISLLRAASTVWSLDAQASVGQVHRTLELNAIQDGKNYGWPYCFGRAEVEQTMTAPVGESSDVYCARTAPATFLAQVDAEPAALVFADTAALPAPYGEGAFVALRGLRQQGVASRVLFIAFENGVPSTSSDFATVVGADSDSGEPLSLSGLTVTSDGSLLVADDVNGVIYRIYPE
jgi:glucose/arabinose dehydrogenase